MGVTLPTSSNFTRIHETNTATFFQVNHSSLSFGETLSALLPGGDTDQKIADRLSLKLRKKVVSVQFKTPFGNADYSSFKPFVSIPREFIPIESDQKAYQQLTGPSTAQKIYIWAHRLAEMRNSDQDGPYPYDRNHPRFESRVAITFKGSQITEIPADIGKIDTLEEIDASYNLLEMLPNELAYLYKLRNLNLSHNKFTSIPKVIYSLPKENSQKYSLVDLRGNPLTRIARNECLLKQVLRYLGDSYHGPFIQIESYEKSFDSLLEEWGQPADLDFLKTTHQHHPDHIEFVKAMITLWLNIFPDFDEKIPEMIRLKEFVCTTLAALYRVPEHEGTKCQRILQRDIDRGIKDQSESWCLTSWLKKNAPPTSSNPLEIELPPLKTSHKEHLD